MSDIPERGVVFWPVGCGDSTTLIVDDETVVQIDLHHCVEAEPEEDDHAAVIDRLIEILPERDGKPYLAAFGATHLDADHTRGFERLLEEVTIGDLWFTPRILWEQDQDELIDDAKAFVEEAERRIEKIKTNSEVDSGDRVRIIGFMDAVKDAYQDVPEGSVTVPGNAFTAIDGVDLEGVFRAFVHAPFKDDGESDRNDTSFALQVTLSGEDGDLRVLLLGDLAYPTLKNIFDRSDDVDLEWDVMLAVHHCSKRAMYEKENDADVLRRDILDALEAARAEGAYIVASATEIPSADTPGANPPHRKAAQRYEEIVDDGHFLVTEDQAPDVIAFTPGVDGTRLREAASVSGSSVLGAAIAAARGATKPAGKRVGFGASRA
jgi:hypothetical protein